MALYIPTGRRRRRTIAVAVAALVIGMAAGWVVGRASSTSIGGRVDAVRAEARQTAAGLRVIALHDQTGAGAGGADLVLARTRTELDNEFARAPWLTRAQRVRLNQALDALRAISDRATPAFGAAAEALAVEIEETFGAGG